MLRQLLLSPLTHLCMCVLSRIQLFCDSWTVAHQASLSTGFSRQEYWMGLPFPPPGDLPDSATEPTSLVSPVLAGRFFTTAPRGKPTHLENHKCTKSNCSAWPSPTSLYSAYHVAAQFHSLCLAPCPPPASTL